MRSVLAAIGLWLCCTVGSAHAAGARIALVIGNSNYTAITPLKNPARDAQLIRRTLRDKLGFEVIYAENAGKAVLDRAVARYGDRLARAAAKIVILDACRDNPLAARFSMDGGGGLGDIALGNSEFIIGYAATSGLSAEDGDGKNSPYAIALARHLATPNQEISEILRMVRSDVVTSTKGRQLPEARTTLLRALYLNGAPPPEVKIAASRTTSHKTATRKRAD